MAYTLFDGALWGTSTKKCAAVFRRRGKNAPSGRRVFCKARRVPLRGAGFLCGPHRVPLRAAGFLCGPRGFSASRTAFLCGPRGSSALPDPPARQLRAFFQDQEPRAAALPRCASPLCLGRFGPRPAAPITRRGAYFAADIAVGVSLSKISEHSSWGQEAAAPPQPSARPFARRFCGNRADGKKITYFYGTPLVPAGQPGIGQKK